MKTDIYRFERAVSNIDGISQLAERAAQYSGLDKRQTLKLNLLCEELVEMLPNLLLYGEGELWIEAKGKSFEIHSVVKADDLLTSADRKEILKVSKSGRNAAAVGIMSKIRIAAEVMLANYALSDGGVTDNANDNSPFEFYDAGLTDPFAENDMWSLSVYRNKVSANTDDWDELERSIIANLADDVTVGIIAGRVEIIIKKSF